MAVVSGPDIVQAGLMVHLDAANIKSYPGTGTSWLDASGNNRTGTMLNGVTFDLAGYMTFDGSLSQEVTVPFGTLVRLLTDPLTVECWIHVPSSASWTSPAAGIFARGNSAGIQGIIRSGTNNVVAAYWRGQTSGVASVSFTITRDRWFHLVSQWTGTDVLFYVNGTLIGSTTATLVGNFDGGDWRLGGNNIPSGTTPGDYLTGSINGCRIYDRVLSATEVQQNFEATRGRYGI